MGKRAESHGWRKGKGAELLAKGWVKSKGTEQETQRGEDCGWEAPGHPGTARIWVSGRRALLQACLLTAPCGCHGSGTSWLRVCLLQQVKVAQVVKAGVTPAAPPSPWLPCSGRGLVPLLSPSPCDRRRQKQHWLSHRGGGCCLWSWFPSTKRHQARPEAVRCERDVQRETSFLQKPDACLPF